MIATAWRSAVTRWFLLISTVVFLVGWVLRIQPLAPVWGTVGEWVAGLATAGGLVFTGLAVRDSSRERAREEAARVIQEQQRQEAQARSVAITSTAQRGNGTKQWTVQWTVLNGGDYPVDNAVVLIAGESGFDAVAQAGTAAEVVCGTLIPNKEITQATDIALDHGPAFAELNTLAYVVFTDAWGNHWARGPGLLAKRETPARSC